MKILLFALIALSLISCKEEKSKENIPDSLTHKNNPTSLNVPDGFDYKMDRDIQFKLQVLDPNGNPGRLIGIRIYEPSEHELSTTETAIPSIEPIPALIYAGQTDATGYLEEVVRIPMHLKSVQVQASQLGINNLVTLSITNDVIFHEFK